MSEEEVDPKRPQFGNRFLDAEKDDVFKHNAWYEHYFKKISANIFLLALMYYILC